MSLYPEFNDNDRDLWKKIATGWYDYAVTFGITGLTPPGWNDSINDLQRKTCYYSARLAAIKF